MDVWHEFFHLSTTKLYINELDQIRIDQISKELSSRILEKEDNEDLQLAGTMEHHRNNSEVK